MRKNKCPVCGYDVVEIPRSAGKELRKKRESKEICQQAVAAQLGVSVGYVSMLELGQRKLNHDFVHRFLAFVK